MRKVEWKPAGVNPDTACGRDAAATPAIERLLQRDRHRPEIRVDRLSPQQFRAALVRLGAVYNATPHPGLGADNRRHRA